METTWSRNQIISALLKSPHGKLDAYIEPARIACASDPEFVEHVIAWQWENGSIRDAKVALPVLALKYAQNTIPEYEENALAHIALLSPRELLRVYAFAKQTQAGTSRVGKLIARYMRHRESERGLWTRSALLFRRDMQQLYFLSHQAPSPWAKAILYDRQYAPGSVWEAVQQLHTMTPEDIGAAMAKFKLPYLVVTGALGARMKEPELLTAIIQSMTPTEVVTNTGMLTKLGVTAQPATRAAFDAKLAEASTSKRAPVLKTTRAAHASTDTVVQAKLRGTQERQLAATHGIDGDVLILADKSGSMQQSIEYARHLGATLTQLVRGKVTLMFFDTMPRVFEVTRKTYDQLLAATHTVHSGGGTSIGCGLQMALDHRWAFDRIVVVSDGGENTPPVFAEAYKKYSAWQDREVPVYFFHVPGERNVWCRNMDFLGCGYERFDVSGSDYYGINTIVQTLRTSRYSLAQEIFETPLRTLDEVFAPSKSVARRKALQQS